MDREERQTAKGGFLMYTILTVEFDLVSAKDGSKALACTIGEAMDSGDKSANKAQSAAPQVRHHADIHDPHRG